jgi:glycine/D-amino acid oxidase-like deaminating enzyme
MSYTFVTWLFEEDFMEFVVVGNGSLGLMIAVSVARANPNWAVKVVGPSDRRYSASTAAGAMINVYAEVEAVPNGQKKLGEGLLEMGTLASEKWLSFLDQTAGNHAITAKQTLVVLKRDASVFEERNFHAMADTALADGVAEWETPDSLNYFAGKRAGLFDSVLRLTGEFAMDSSVLMSHLQEVASNLNVTFVDSIVTKIDPTAKRITLPDKSTIVADLIVAAAGAFTARLFGEEAGLLPMFQGVGTALAVERVPDGVRPAEVIRTVNRGGAQCGVHMVPIAGEGLYIGAGNNVSIVQKPSIRFETVSYLLETVQKEFLGRNVGYAMEGSIRLGLRPRSLDGYPMIGALSRYDGIFIATATNRAGLTWAPEIADQVVRWASGGSVQPFMERWAPDRTSLLSGSEEDVLENYVESRIGAGLEHGTVHNTLPDLNRARREIRAVGEKLISQLSKAGLRGVHPDNWAAATSLSGLLE